MPSESASSHCPTASPSLLAPAPASAAWVCAVWRAMKFSTSTQPWNWAYPAFSSAYDAPFCQHRRVFRTSSRDWTCIRCRFPDTEILHLGALFRRKHELKLLLAHRNRQRDQIDLLAGVRDRRPIGELWHREVQHALNVALGRNGVGQKLALLQLFGACVALRQLRTVAVADFTVAQLASQVTRF